MIDYISKEKSNQNSFLNQYVKHHVISLKSKLSFWSSAWKFLTTVTFQRDDTVMFVKIILEIEILAILQKSLDRATFLNILIREVRLNDVSACISIEYISKYYEIYINIVPFIFFLEQPKDLFASKVMSSADLKSSDYQKLYEISTKIWTRCFYHSMVPVIYIHAHFCFRSPLKANLYIQHFEQTGTAIK